MQKNDKGISLTTAVITVMVVIIILTTLSYSAINNIKIKKLNQLYSDIRQLNDKVAVYYLKTGSLPIDSSQSYEISTTNTEDEIESMPIKFVLKDSTLVNSESLINPNDYEVDGTNYKAQYYQLDTSLLDNVSLNNAGSFIINSQSHAIYYLDGVVVDGKEYHTLPLEYRDTKHNENYPVTSISLKDGLSYVYLPMGGKQLDLLDYLKFNTDGKGEPRTLTFTSASSNDTYFKIEDGIITSTSAAANTATYNVIVESTSYGSLDRATFTIPIKLTSINLSTGANNTINLVSKPTYYYSFGYKLTKGGSYGTLSYELSNPKVVSIYANSGETYLYFRPISAGTSQVWVSELNGNATKEITVNVLEFLLEDSEGNEISTSAGLTYNSLNETTDLVVQKNGPDIELGTSSDYVKWTSNNTSIVQVTGDSQGATVTPVGFGSTTIKCAFILTSSEKGYYSIPIKVTGIKIIASDDTNTMTLTEGEVVTKDLSFDTNLDTTLIKNYEWVSSSETTATIEINEDNTATVTAEEVGETDITLTVTMEDGKTYTDTFKISVSSS